MKKLIVNPDGTAIIIEYEKDNDDLNTDCNDFMNNKNEGDPK